MGNSEDLRIFLEDLFDYLNSQEAGIAKLKRQIQKLIGSSLAEAKRECTWNPHAIKWEKAEGASGPYERSEDVNSLDFKAMLKDLAERGGKLTREGIFYWMFKNGATVGRKKLEAESR